MFAVNHLGSRQISVKNRPYRSDLHTCKASSSEATATSVTFVFADGLTPTAYVVTIDPITGGKHSGPGSSVGVHRSRICMGEDHLRLPLSTGSIIVNAAVSALRR
jgi:hypothetical protein